MSRILLVAVVVVLCFPLSAFPQSLQNAAEDMVLIPAGEFMMGSPSNERGSDERPQHRVYVDAFYLDKYETTNAQFKDFVDETGHVTDAEKRGYGSVWSGSSWDKVDGADWRHPRGPNSSINGMMDHPVVQVSWNDAVIYANWAGKRLPTEAEWECACQAGTTTQYSFGSNAGDLDLYGWYEGDSKSRTHPVGKLRENAWGLHDMHGNVWEWCSDWYNKSYYSSSPSSNPKGPTSGRDRVARGGSWHGSARSARSANREYNAPSGASSSLGFRCAQDVE